VSYREHPAGPALSPWVECLWERIGDAQEAAQPVRVLPDGCIDVIWTPGGGAQLVGANTTAFVSDMGRGGQRVVGARMRPGAAPALLGISAPAVLDARPALASVLHDDGRRLEQRLGHDRVDPLGELHRWLAERARMATAPDPLVATAVGRLADERHALIPMLASDLGVSERGLRRRVTTLVGYGPKRLARVLRLRRALALAQAGEDLSGAAFLAGYADQAHFSNECRELAGLPPAALRTITG
jgi:AraC-like DNA-binding protein